MKHPSRIKLASPNKSHGLPYLLPVSAGFLPFSHRLACLLAFPIPISHQPQTAANPTSARPHRNLARFSEEEMGEYCGAAPEEDPAMALVTPLPTTTTTTTAAAAANKQPHYYGCFDRCSTKQVFDNLHGNISLDPVRSLLLPLPSHSAGFVPLPQPSVSPYLITLDIASTVHLLALDCLVTSSNWGLVFVSLFDRLLLPYSDDDVFVPS